MPIFIADPLDFFNQRDREQAAWLNKLPKCSKCGKPIQQDTAVCLECDWYCDDCLYDFRKDVVEE